MKRQRSEYNFVVCGGGLAGLCAAIAAARRGARVCLVHNRPVLGGNSSSEIGVTPHGAAAFHAYARETGIISELLIEERARNHADITENGWTNSVWDMVLYDAAMAEPNLTLMLNTDVIGVRLTDEKALTRDPADESIVQEVGYFHRPSLLKSTSARIACVVAYTLNAEVETELYAQSFADCTGDALIAHLAGCEWRMGTEGSDEFDEPHAANGASRDTMGNSIHFLARDVGRPVPYTAPDWAMHYEDASYFYDSGRVPKEKTGGFWWLEIGVPYHTIHDNEQIRHELTRHALGVWEWMKNHDPNMKDKCANYALDWIGQVPGKRESRRVIGRYFMTEHDVQKKTVFEDEIAFGGWFVDLHTPGGLLADTSEPASAEDNYNTFSEYAVKSYCGPYGIPLRICLSRDVDNLFMAGRNVSVTHAALGTVRVMATTALIGQGVGTAAAYQLRHQTPTDELCTGEPIRAIRQQLLRDGCFLPNASNEDQRDLAREAAVTASSEATVACVDPDTPFVDGGLKHWRDQPQFVINGLDRRLGQLIPVGRNGLHNVGALLENVSDQPQTVEAKLLPVSDCWHYRIKLKSLAEEKLEVPPGRHWVDLSINVSRAIEVVPNSFVRLDLEANESVRWVMTPAIAPGCLASYQIGEDQMRRFGHGQTLSFRVDPPQQAYPAKHVQSGVTRPLKSTNLWRSDPLVAGASWVALEWPKPQTITNVELVFPGHLLREYHAYAPYFRDPQCPADYRIEARKNGDWQTLVAVKGNYHRHRRHRIEAPVPSKLLRIVIDQTNGDPSAMIYEIRCYAD